MEYGVEKFLKRCSKLNNNNNCCILDVDQNFFLNVASKG